MLIINTDKYLDDALTCIPLLKYLAATSAEPVYYQFYNSRITSEYLLDIFGNAKPYSDMATGLGFEKTYVLNSSMVKGTDLYPTQAYFKRFNLPFTESSERVTGININNDDKTFDIVYAPYTNSNTDSAGCFLSKEEIVKLYSKGLRIAIVGPRDLFYLYDPSLVTYLHNDYLMGQVIQMANAKLIITCDNEYSRLVDLYNLQDKHILLSSSINKQSWYGYPNAKGLYGNPLTWSPETIYNLITQELGERICH